LAYVNFLNIFPSMIWNLILDDNLRVTSAY
jgi:hypothetical protein